MSARVVIDIATSGSNPAVHAILEICLVKVDSSYNVIQAVTFKVKYKDLVVSPDALAFNGVDVRDSAGWSDAVAVRDGICMFLSGKTHGELQAGARVPKYVHVGLGAAFDNMFLHTFLGPVVASALFIPRCSEIGTLFEAALIAGVVPQPASDHLLSLAAAAGATIPDEGEHSATRDAQMAVYVGRQCFLRLKEAGQLSRGETPCTGF